jgi:hypothetical protein
VQEAPQPARCGRQVTRQQSLEFNDGLLVEDDVIDVVDRDASVIKAPADRLMRERRIALDACEPLFLSRVNDVAVFNQRGGRVPTLRLARSAGTLNAPFSPCFSSCHSTSS